jgi:hypothetical protein
MHENKCFGGQSWQQPTRPNDNSIASTRNFDLPFIAIAAFNQHDEVKSIRSVFHRRFKRTAVRKTQYRTQ